MELFNEEIQITEFEKRVVRRPVFGQNEEGFTIISHYEAKEEDVWVIKLETLDDEDYVGYTGTSIRYKLVEYGESTPEFKFIRRKLLEACNFDVLDGVIRFEKSEKTLAYLANRKNQKLQDGVFTFVEGLVNIHVPNWQDFIIPYRNEKAYFKGNLV